MEVYYLVWSSLLIWEHLVLQYCILRFSGSILTVLTMKRLRSFSNSIRDHLLPSKMSTSEQESSSFPTFPRPENPEGHMLYALEIAKKTIAKPTNFCVGATIVDETENHILATGYTNEFPDNTHAEQCALQKLEKKLLANPSQWLAPDAKLVLYTTMEPCNKRSSGNIPCTETILRYNQHFLARSIGKIYYGTREPETFVGANKGQEKLEGGGILLQHTPGLEKEILEVATAGHDQKRSPEHSPGH